MTRLGLATIGAWAVLGAAGTGPTVAGATTLTTSYATWAANAGAGAVETTVTGAFTPLDPLATVSSVTLPSGTIGLSDPNTVVERAAPAPYGAVAFNFATASSPAGFFGDLLVPSGSSITLTPSGSISALGFYVGTTSSSLQAPGGGYSVSVKLANGQTVSQAALGGNVNTGTETADFFGFYGGPIASLTITDTDPAGFAFGDFTSVPEPGTVGLLLAGLVGVVGRRRRA